MRSVAARTSESDACVRSGAMRPRLCSSLPAATSSGSIQGVASFIASPPSSFGGLSRTDIGRRRRRRQPRQHFLGEEADALFGFLVVEEARAADKDEMAEPADLLVDVHDLLIDCIGVTGAENAAGD